MGRTRDGIGFPAARSKGKSMTRHAVAIIVPAGLLIGLVLMAPRWHVPLGLVAWGFLRWKCPELTRSIGRPIRWMSLLAFLVFLGAWLGPTDMRTRGIDWSAVGAWSAGTMIVRAFALITAGAVLTAHVPLRRWLGQMQSPFVKTIFEIVVVAASLVPVLLRALVDAWNTLRERRPGWRRLPQRLRLIAIHAVVRAANLADTIALDMAIAAHNAGRPIEEEE